MLLLDSIEEGDEEEARRVWRIFNLLANVVVVVAKA